MDKAGLKLQPTPRNATLEPLNAPGTEAMLKPRVGPEGPTCVSKKRIPNWFRGSGV